MCATCAELPSYISTMTGPIHICVQEFVEHPDYDVARIENDVALVKLPSNSVPAYTSEYRNMVFYIRWLIILLCAHMEQIRHLITSKESSNPIFLFGRDLLHHTCASCSKLPSYISSMVSTNLQIPGQKCLNTASSTSFSPGVSLLSCWIRIHISVSELTFLFCWI